MVSFLAFLLVFTIAVLAHETGHYLAARRLGVAVYEFSIGFPFSPRVATLFRRGKTEFTLRLLPLGGFVSFSPDGGEAETAEYLAAGRWRRAVIASAGSVFNIILAVFLITAALCLNGDAGLSGAFFSGLATVVEAFTGTIRLIFGLLSGSGSLDSLAGPIGIAAAAGKAAYGGLPSLLYFTGFLSLSLGILNLLPLPALDGGHLVILLLESLKGGPLSENTYRIAGLAGILFFLTLTVFVSYNDILKLVA